MKIFPIIIITLFFGASIVCFYLGDWKKGIYWFAGALVNLAVIL